MFKDCSILRQYSLLLITLMVLAGCRLDIQDDASSDLLARYNTTPIVLSDFSSFGILDHSPVAGSQHQSLVREVMITFDTAVLAATVNAQSVQLMQGEQQVDARLVYVNDTHTVRLIPREALQPSREYRVQITSSLLSDEGDPFGGVSWMFSTAGLIGNTSQSTLSQCGNALALEMLDAVNQARSSGQQCGSQWHQAAQPLAYQCQLAEVAQSHARDMARYQVLSHLSSDGMGLADRFNAFGISWERLAENVAVTPQSSVATVVARWLESPSHCTTLLDPELTHIGIGNDSNEGLYFWVQNLATGVSEPD